MPKSKFNKKEIFFPFDKKIRFKLKRLQSKKVKKTASILAVVGGLIGLGIVLSVYGNFLIFEDLARADNELSSGEGLAIEVELDHSKTQKGIYAIQIMDLERSEITVTILDPSNSEIEFQSINEELFEGFFEVSTSGNYKLLIENRGEQVRVFGVIGPEPETWKQSLDAVSFVILASGLIGMAGLAIYIIWNRKKNLS